MAVRYSVTIFLSAFLLFAVQPLIGKYILPWFGGGAGIWTACMLFFQCVLLSGYLYAHLISSWLVPRQQMILHLALLALSLLVLPITPDPSWKPVGAGQPTKHILLLLLVNLGLPFALLSATGPLLSGWFSHSFDNRSPWRLYALSNTGSLLALLSYPFIVEPYFALPQQTWFWSAGYLLFVLFCGFCAWQFGHRVELSVPRVTEPDTDDSLTGTSSLVDEEQTHSPGWIEMLLWLVLAANASMMLLATTHQISQDLAVIPLLWILPLALYLLSFILCFDHDWWYKRGVFIPLFAAGALGVVYSMSQEQFLSVWIQIVVYSVTLFAACMVCHGELVRLRPGVRHLTRYYLVIGSGGALGGVLVALVAPAIFNDYWEYHIGLAATCFLVIICFYRVNKQRQFEARNLTKSIPDHQRVGKTKKNKKYRKQQRELAREAAWLRRKSTSALVASLLVATVVVSGLGLDIKRSLERTLISSRSFYGVTHILQFGNQARIMEHGRTIHGTQLLGAGLGGIPTTYYELNSGLDIALSRYRYLQSLSNNDVAGSDNGLLRIGVVGLGTGTIAALTRSGDFLRYYEIDAEVERLARRYFSYIENSKAEFDLVLGDARIVLEQEANNGQLQEFDALVIDAFNSDAVPMHLLTTEAIDLYLRHLKPDGLLLFNTANRYLDLGAVVRGLARNADRGLVRFVTPGTGLFPFSSNWIVMTSNTEFLSDKTVQIAATDWREDDLSELLWTDEYASLWQAVDSGAEETREKWDLAPNSGRFIVDDAHLINNDDIRRIGMIGRNIYDDSHGKAAVMLVTVPSRPAVGGRLVPPPVLLGDMYQNLGLSRRGNGLNVLILVSEQDELAYIQGPKNWQPELRDPVITAVSDMMQDGILAPDFSERIVDGISTIGQLLRGQL